MNKVWKVSLHDAATGQSRANIKNQEARKCERIIRIATHTATQSHKFYHDHVCILFFKQNSFDQDFALSQFYRHCEMTEQVPWDIALPYPPSQHSAHSSLQPLLYPGTIDPNLIFVAGGQVRFSQTASSFGDYFNPFPTQSQVDYPSPGCSYPSPAKYVFK